MIKNIIILPGKYEESMKITNFIVNNVNVKNIKIIRIG